MKTFHTRVAVAVLSLVAGCTPIASEMEGPAPNTSIPGVSILGAQFATDFAAHDVVIIGETHGTREIPQLVAKLSDSLGPRTLFALELRPESEEMTCPPVKIALSWQREGADGRSSEAMLAALCNIRSNAEKHGTEMLLIDSRSETQRTFYTSAAAEISAKLDGGKYDRAVVLTGNFHSKNDDNHLAAALRSLGKSVITATASTSVGTAWQCVQAGCGMRQISLEFCEDDGSPGPNWTTVAREELGWDRCLTFPSLTASPPADDGTIGQ